MRDDAGTAHQLVGGHLDHVDPGPAGLRRRLPHEVGLADAGLTLQQQHPADTGRRRRHQLGDRRQLGDPPDRRRAGRCSPVLSSAAHSRQRSENPFNRQRPRSTNRTAGAVPTSWRTTSDTSTSPPAARPGDARRRVDRTPERVGVDVDHLTGVDPETDPRRRPGQRTLRRQGERHRLTRRRERHQQPVTQRLHLAPAVGLDALTHHVELPANRRQSRLVADPVEAAPSSPRHRRTPPSSTPGPRHDRP